MMIILYDYGFGKDSVRFNNPIYAGFSILDPSKLHMYIFHNDMMKEKSQDDTKSLMTDTAI